MAHLSRVDGTLYTSPPRKLLKFFIASRDRWKTKCREAKNTVKRLKNRLRSVEQRKAQLKQRRQELEAECVRLREENQR